ncbi:WxcM-like domain-containing protein [Candidatus Pacearchaeota archaeon]|nr:WxcM-like domain-containing protein [Candidatus Pacearchaeota archaeon]
MNSEIIKLEKHEDKRGSLVEFHPYCYFVTFHPGMVRGNHYHLEKIEWIIAPEESRIEIILEDIKTKTRRKFILDNLERLTIGPGVAHAFKNIGDVKAIMIVQRSKEYNPADDYHYELYKS